MTGVRTFQWPERPGGPEAVKLPVNSDYTAGMAVLSVSAILSHMENQSSDLFDGVPGPTPWYVRAGTTAVEGFTWQQTRGRAWKDATESSQLAGKTLLVGEDGIVAVFDFENWIMRLDDSTLLVWNQGKAAPSVRLVAFRPGPLPPFEADVEEIARRMHASGSRMELAVQPLASCALSATVIDEDVAAEFPQELHQLEELLILCHSPAIPKIPGMQVDLALLVARPAQGVFRLYPQDWFNAADLDFGYQWVTRVVRNPRTGHIHGEGIRIAPFELDESQRRLVDRCRLI
jgi:hypothetical protein